MSVIDIIIGLILIYGGIRGYMRGLVLELAHLLSIVVGFYGAIHFSYFLANYMQKNLDWDPNVIKILAFSITLAIITFVIILIAKMFTKLLSYIALGLPNKIFGAVFGLLKLAIIIGAIIAFLSQVGLNFPAKWTNGSLLFEPVKAIGDFIFGSVIKKF